MYPRIWDIFCKVVDNFGDAGVSWRLARQLAAEHGARVRFWIDDLESLRLLVPSVHAVESQRVDDVDIFRWVDKTMEIEPSDVIIEAFGCGVPDAYLNTMARADPAPLWIVLEYLSAEPWVREHHLLPSPHPRAPLGRYFFFPGFVEGTGGLLREADLFARRDAFDEARRARFWRSVGYEPPPPCAMTVSMFAYESAPLVELMRCYEEGPHQTVLAVPSGAAVARALAYFGTGSAPTGALYRGALEMRVLPFLPQARYDELLWSCDCNFVRGEDSFVRAQWAARPFTWHIYPQEDEAHSRKLEAFLELYTAGLPDGARDAAVAMMRVWNQVPASGVTPASAWRAYALQCEVLREHGTSWAARIARPGSLADNLVRFCADKLK